MPQLAEIFRVWSGNAASPGKTVTANGNLVQLNGSVNSPTIPVGSLDMLDINANVTSLRGVLPTITFVWSRIDPFGNAFPMATTGLSAAGKATLDIGPGLSNGFSPGSVGQFSWTLAGTVISTTVGTGANSTTQNLSSTTGILAGDSLFFHTANVTVTVVSVTDGSHLVVNTAVSSTNGETVTVPNTPAATMTIFGEGK